MSGGMLGAAPADVAPVGTSPQQGSAGDRRRGTRVLLTGASPRPKAAAELSVRGTGFTAAWTGEDRDAQLEAG
jgi:hypothetical protein